MCGRFDHWRSFPCVSYRTKGELLVLFVTANVAAKSQRENTCKVCNIQCGSYSTNGEPITEIMSANVDDIDPMG